jgi:CheY-like chemotaxis protein
VEDNADIIFNLDLSLKSNNFQVKSASNGKEALEILSKMKEVPDLIISDIMMPEMDGYELFKTISNDNRLNEIPFIFLTAKASPEDIRFGKLLGIDDYLTKPINEKDLIAVIKGKLSRKKKSNSIDVQIIKYLSSYDIDLTPSLLKTHDKNILLMLVFWDDRLGPELKAWYPEEEILPIPIEKIANQLFNAAMLIYGQDNILKADGILLNIENINRHGYIFFDSYPDPSERFGEKQFMLALIAPKINYFESLKIREIFLLITEKIKEVREYSITEFYQKLLNTLSTSPL